MPDFIQSSLFHIPLAEPIIVIFSLGTPLFLNKLAQRKEYIEGAVNNQQGFSNLLDELAGSLTRNNVPNYGYVGRTAILRYECVQGEKDTMLLAPFTQRFHLISYQKQYIIYGYGPLF